MNIVPHLVTGSTSASAGHPRSPSHARPHSITLPPELLRSAPRDVALNGSGKALTTFAAGFVVIALGLGPWLGAKALADAERRERLAREGVTTEAVVLTARRTRGDDPRDIIRYRFAAGGAYHEKNASLRRRRSPALKAGDSVRVRYLKSDPARNWVAGYEPRGAPFWLAPLVTVSFLGFAGLMFRSIQKQKSLLREGRPALAKVVRTETIKERAQYRVTLEFRDLSGAARAARFYTQKDPGMNELLPILYDRERPTHCAQYPFSLVRVIVPQA